MSEGNQALAWQPSPVADKDLVWISSILRLPATAFCGETGADPRKHVLRTNGTLDVAACPGSGKTTLLVAKLAILARHWTARGYGVCVLSHTNVARQEIERQLGSTPEGRRLLAYPHFIGTIHAFFNQELALPWLRSKSMPPRLIDDDFALRRRWEKLTPSQREGLERNGHGPGRMKVRHANFDLGDFRWGKGQLGRDTATYQALRNVCRTSMMEGYFCHDEMFVWAEALIDAIPDVRASVRRRFPIIFVDEVQDNSEEQGRLLYKLFIEGDGPVTRQRFGDMNQAIFGVGADEDDAATTDAFPTPERTIVVPNSHRFHQGIADLADPLALSPQGLIGLRTLADGEANATNAIFLFDDSTIGDVLPAYANHLVNVLPENLLRTGVFTAVGHVHRPKSGASLPQTVGDYWVDYNCELSAAEPQPAKFLQYLAGGRAPNGDVRSLVERTADALLALVHIAHPLVAHQTHQRRHRCVLELLAPYPDARDLYLRIARAIADGRRPTSAKTWAERWVPKLQALASLIADSDAIGDDRGFLDWQPGAATIGKLPCGNNIFRHPAMTPTVRIKVGSIHSVKGETHTGTLVLDTFFHKHHLTRLKPWLLGDRAGRTAGLSRIVISSLKQHYVAMTRPTHVLCLAMRAADLNPEELQRLRARRWQVGLLRSGHVDWV